MQRIPDLPGRLIPPRSQEEAGLRRYVSSLCRLEHDRFPGSQPVSFVTKDLTRLETQDFWVCEKSDGVRVLFFVQTDVGSNTQTTYLIDRHNSYHELTGFFFPHHENPVKPLKDSIVDGELVLDFDPLTRQTTLRFLAFDCLVVDLQNVMSRPLDKRYGRLKEWFYKPYARMMHDHPHVAASVPFDIQVKDISFSYGVDKVFHVDIPALQHGTDGLIYTCVNTPYTSGTDPNILKWKPPSENSIDFKLVLRFPPVKNNPHQPDFLARPFFGLQVYCGNERGQPKYEPYDELHVDDEEWEKMKLSGEQFDDRIIEVHWDPAIRGWRMMRFRDDKPDGNYKTVVEQIIQSIADGVEKEALLGRSSIIRNAWKARHGQPQQPMQPQQPIGPPAYPTPKPPTNYPPIPSPSHLPPTNTDHLKSAPQAQLRYGPMVESRWSKVSGPSVFAGMNR